jgi:hypothetical protein
MSELDEIREKYESGKLDSIKEDLERFLDAHRLEIAACRAEQELRGVPVDLESAVKLFILRHRSINPARDISEQLEEILKEKWIRGIRTGCAPDAQKVALEWAQCHSAGWRQHRLTTIVYVFERDKQRYLGILKHSCE